MPPPNEGQLEEQFFDAIHSSPESQLFEAITSKDLEQVKQIIRNNPDLNLNCLDKDELTPLQHACHIGDTELAKLLIENGAEVNFTQRKDGYTPLMFAAISARMQIVQLLLERGVDINIENCVNRNAAQMAAFVGQTKIVSIINSWIPYEKSIEPYTRCRELESKPRISSPALGRLLHDYITYPSLHPIKLMLFIRDHPDLIKYGSQFIYVLENLSSKSLKSPACEECLSLKYYYLSYLLEYCLKIYKNSRTKDKSIKQVQASDRTFEQSFEPEASVKLVQDMIKKLIRKGSGDQSGRPCTAQLDRFIVECLMKFPYTQLSLYKTMTYALTKSEQGDLNALSILTQTLNGPRMFGHTSEACLVCGECDKNKQCSRCKAVYYCDKSCQQIDWFQHKKVCKSPEEEPLLNGTNDDNGAEDYP